MSEGSLAKDTFGGRFVISCVVFGKLLICRFANNWLTIIIKVTSLRWQDNEGCTILFLKGVRQFFKTIPYIKNAEKKCRGKKSCKCCVLTRSCVRLKINNFWKSYWPPKNIKPNLKVRKKVTPQKIVQPPLPLLLKKRMVKNGPYLNYSECEPKARD